MFLLPQKTPGGISSSAALTVLAGRALTAPLVSVTDKEMLPPDGDKHDYLSIATYWHPESPDRPWVRRDGIRNPDIDRYDRKRLEDMAMNAVTLILAYVAEGEEEYRARAMEILRHFFLEPETKMNPNLNYAQFIPGVCDGRGIGIIDTVKLLFLADVAEFLPRDRDREALRGWYADYLDWMLTSENGKAECGEHNNHGTWYDVQAAGFALFAGKEETARERLASCAARIASQITPEGRQEHEEARTLSLSYSTFNLLGFYAARNMAERLGIPFETARIEAACCFLAPYWEKPESWPFRQIAPFNNRAAAAVRVLRGDTPVKSLYAYIINEEI